MLKAGLTSVTFREKTPEEVIRLTAEAGLSGIEWASHTHAHQGDVALAREIARMTRDAGLEVSSYGSYFQLGTDRDITPFLESAQALGTDQMRIWGGNTGSADLTYDQRQALIEESQQISQKATQYGVTLSLESHNDTITDTLSSQVLCLFEVNRPNFCSYWQAALELPLEQRLHTIRTLYATGKLTNIHLFWYNDKREQQLLREGAEYITNWLSVLKDDPATRYALIEFVKDGTEENFFQDAKTLLSIVDTVNHL